MNSVGFSMPWSQDGNLKLAFEQVDFDFRPYLLLCPHLNQYVVLNVPQSILAINNMVALISSSV